MKSNLIFLTFIFFLFSCNTQYKSLIGSINNLPIKKMLLKGDHSSGVTGNVDSIFATKIRPSDRMDFILKLDTGLQTRFNNYKSNNLRI